MKNRSYLPVAAGLVALAVLAFGPGCGTDNSPLISDSPTLAQPDSEPVYLSFASRSNPGAAKVASDPAEWLTTAEVVVPDESNALTIRDWNEPGKRDDLRADLIILRGSVQESVLITMGMNGNTLGDLVMGFKPAGLEFDRPATLVLTIGLDRVDVDLADIAVYHFSQEDDDSDPEEAHVISVTETADAVRLVVVIPSFSRYSLSPGCCSWDDGF